MNNDTKEQFYPLTFTCGNVECKLSVRIGRLLNKPSNMVGGFNFCPCCGQRGLGMISVDDEESYWETMSTHFGEPVAALKILYDLWNPNEHTRFGDYVRQIQQEVKDESNDN